MTQASRFRPASDGLDLRHEFELVKRILHLVVLQKISRRYIKDATEGPEIDCRALPDFSGEPGEIIVVVPRRLAPIQSQSREPFVVGLAHTSFAIASPQTRTAPRPKALIKTIQRTAYRRSSFRAILISHTFKAEELKRATYIYIPSRHYGVDDSRCLKDGGRSPNIPGSRGGS
jgi:hypothetical protein